MKINLMLQPLSMEMKMRKRTSVGIWKKLEGLHRSELLPRLLELEEDDTYVMPDEVFLEVLGDMWPLCDNVGWCRENMELDGKVECALHSQVTSGTQHVPVMMYPEERAALADLPEHVTIYRGCGPQNRRGFSWTLCRDVAVRIFEKGLYGQKRPLLLTATIDRRLISAVKLGKEYEVILFRPALKMINIHQEALPRMRHEIGNTASLDLYSASNPS
jgi:hypothetical protein